MYRLLLPVDWIPSSENDEAGDVDADDDARSARSIRFHVCGLTMVASADARFTATLEGHFFDRLVFGI